MNGLAMEIAFTLLLPLLLAMAVAWACGLLLAEEAAARWRLAAGAAAGMLLGYVLLPEWAPLAPDRHWHWLPYLAVGAAVLGAVTAARGVAKWEWLLAIAVLAIVAAFVLVPTWDTLDPPRRVLIPLLAGYVVLIHFVLAGLPDKVRGPNYAYLLALTAFGVAALVGYEVSVKFGQLGASFAAALVGVSLVSLRFRRTVRPDEAGKAAADGSPALASIYAVAIGGLAFVATIEPTEPATPLLLAPLAPAVLWLFVAGPVSRMKPLLATALQTVLVLAILTTVAIWLYLRSAAETDEWSHQHSTERCALQQQL